MKTMKKIYSGILFMAGLLALSSCDKSGTEIREEGGAITISLSSAELETRATKEGEDTYNENTIKRIDWFLYEKGKTSGSAAKYGRVDNLNAKGEETIRVNVTEEEVNTVIFPKNLGKNVCDVFLIVNLPDGVTISGTSVAELEALAIEANFASGTQKSFVMTGDGEATIVDRKKILAASGTIDVDRVASKISLTAKVAKSIVADGTTWVSDPSSMKIQFCKGQNTAVLSGDPTAKAKYFDYNKRTYSENTEKTENGFTIWNGDPFYSYPKTWNSGDKDAEPYLLIELPWSSQGGATNTYKSCYYKVFLSSEELVRNTWYDITLTLSVLGSFTETEPTVMITDLEYKVCDWSSFEFSAEIQAARYLVVDQNEYVMNNIPTLEIPFLSSHDCKLMDVKVTKRDIKNGGDIDVTSGYNIDIVGSNIVYSNVLNNDYTSPTFDFVPYTITLTIRHKDDSKFTQTIKITQYPAIYGLDYENSDWSNDDEENGDNGFVFVNGYQGSSAKAGQDFFCSANGMQNAYGGASPNMYVFTVTNVNGTNYIIGDPRETIVSDIVDDTHNSNGTRSVWYSAQSLNPDGTINTTKRILKNYFATDASDRTKNMVAPKFRVASAYAVLNTGASEAEKLEYLKKRCASYQEDGYPAGRWRLPTQAEFSLIFSQVNRGNLPPIYEVGTKYWCAHGLGEPQRNGTVKVTEADGSGHSVRCVYDEWYWGSEQLKNRSQFTWGDMPR